MCNDMIAGTSVDLLKTPPMKPQNFSGKRCIVLETRFASHLATEWINFRIRRIVSLSADVRPSERALVVFR